MSADIYDLDEWARKGTPLSSTDKNSNLKITTVENSSIPSTGTIPLEKLYPTDDQTSSNLAICFKLLEKAAGYSEEALNAFNSGNALEQDDAIMRLRPILAELFCLRSVGEGYASLTLSLFHSLRDLTAEFNELQLASINYALKCLHKEPFMSFDTAIEFIEDLEEAGLHIQSDEFAPLAEVLSE